MVSYGEYQIDSEAKVALEQMRKDCAYSTTIDNIYRSKAQQEQVWNSGVKRRMALGMTKEEFMTTEEFWRVHKMAADGLLWPHQRKKRKE